MRPEPFADVFRLGGAAGSDARVRVPRAAPEGSQAAQRPGWGIPPRRRGAGARPLRHHGRSSRDRGLPGCAAVPDAAAGVRCAAPRWKGSFPRTLLLPIAQLLTEAAASRVPKRG